MSGELADHDPLKWIYTEHARAKHAIQRTYLGAWLAILGTHFSPLVLFDGFAGRGHYEGGEDGSPLLFFKRAAEAVDRGRPAACLHPLRRAEPAQLRRPPSGNRRTAASWRPDRRSTRRVLRTGGSSRPLGCGTRTPVPPVFWTADPYGFRGVPLTTIRELMALPRSEVLITFMVRDMRRFLGRAEPRRAAGRVLWRRSLAAVSGEQRSRGSRALPAADLLEAHPRRDRALRHTVSRVRG